MIAQRSVPADKETAAQEMSIRDYSPRSTLVVNENHPTRAKYPVIDIHSHHRTPLAPDRWQTIVSEMDDLNLQVLVNLSGGSGLKLKEGIAAVRSSRSGPWPVRGCPDAATRVAEVAVCDPA